MNLQQALKTHFGFGAFRPYQEAVVRAAVEGKDVLAVMPTGAGKSLTFQLPALVKEGMALVVSPLIALMEDQVHQLGQKGIRTAETITGRTSPAEADAILARARTGELKLLYVAPERLTSQRFQEAAARLPLSYLVVDEAHCVSEWGHNFRADYRQIRLCAERLGRPPIIAVTATATPAVRRDIVQNLGLENAVEVIGDFDRPNLCWRVVEATRSRKDGEVLRLVKSKPRSAAIVYVPSRKLAESVAGMLADAGVKASFYHAGLSGDMREERQRAFRDGDSQVMCATIAFGMGVHKDDVRQVIHYAMPRSLEAYYQEAGRAGRDGEPAECVLLYSRGDLQYLYGRIDEAYPEKGLLRKIQIAAVRNGLRELADEQDDKQESFTLGLSALLEAGYLTGNPVDGYQPGKGGDEGARALRWLDRHRKLELDRLFRVRDYGEAEGCRTAVLVGYFGQEMERCGHCDVCLDEVAAPVRGGKQKKRPPAEKARAAAPAGAQVLSAVDHDLYEKLRGWRLALAKEWGVPAYQIMNDKTLREVALFKPQDRDTFLLVLGLGEKKWEAFGRELTQFLRGQVQHEG
jgi:ATP-dependent DNA helicase RecQ